MKWVTTFLAAMVVYGATGQNVGIGTPTPLAPLHVSSTSSNPVRFEAPGALYLSFFENGVYRGYVGSYAGNPEDMDFGTGAGNTTGKLHLTTQATPRFTIDGTGNVGIGTTTPQWKLDVNGGMQLQGRLYVSGSSGTTGQVLTSNGLSAPSWQTLTSSFDNNIRFSFTCSDPSNTSGNLAITNRYNLNTTAVAIGSNSITFNTSGIYHFEVAIEARIDYASALGYDPGFNIDLYLLGGVGPGHNYVADCVLRKSGTTNRYSGTAYASTDLYIQAGQVLYPTFLYKNIIAGFTDIETFGGLQGFLISQ